jgi:hypothetical protein
MPIIANAIVNGGENYREQALRSFADRLASLQSLILHISANAPSSLDALLLPAGYFCAATTSQAQGAGEEVAASLARSQPPFAVVWGVDGWTPLSKGELESEPSGYPFFVFVLPRGQSQPMRFQQLAIGAAERDSANDSWGNRSPIFCGGIGLLICGESWSDALLGRIEAVHASVLLIPAHRTVNLMTDEVQGWARLSWHLRLDRFSRRTEIPVILSEHTRSPSRHDYAWGSRAVRQMDLPSDLSNLFTIKLVEF